MGLYITDRRILLPVWVLRIFRVEWMAWYAGRDETLDADYLESVAVGRNAFFGTYLELITWNPVEHWWCSRKARIRLFMRNPEPVCRVITEALAPIIPGSGPDGPTNGSQPIHSKPNQTSPAAGSGR